MNKRKDYGFALENHPSSDHAEFNVGITAPPMISQEEEYSEWEEATERSVLRAQYIESLETYVEKYGPSSQLMRGSIMAFIAIGLIWLADMLGFPYMRPWGYATGLAICIAFLAMGRAIRRG